MEKNSLFKQGGVVLFAIVVGNLLAYFFQIYMGRALGPADYGVLGSLISIFYIISVPVGTITMVVSKFVSQYKVNNEYGKIRSFFFAALKKVVKYGLLVFIIFLVLTPLIARFLNIPTTIPLMLLGVTLLFSLILPVNRGMLQGLQNFNQLSLNMIIEGVMRFALGVLLISLGLGVNGAVLSYGFAYFLAFFIAFIPLRFLFKEKKEGISIPNFYKYSWFVLVAFTCIIVMVNIDIIFVKHFFTSEQAGYYNVASLLSKVLYFVSMAIVSVMFPKVSELHISKGSHKHLLKKGLLYISLLSFLAVLFYIAFPSFIIRIFFGAAYLQAVPLLRLFGIVMAAFAITIIIIFYNLAIENTSIVKFMVISVVLEILLLLLFHKTLMNIITVLLVVSIILLSLTLLFSRRKNG